MTLVQGADEAPTTQFTSVVAQRHAALTRLLAQRTALQAEARTLELE